MANWCVASERDDYASIVKACGIMGSDPAECDDLGRDVWIQFLKSENRWGDVCGFRPTKEMFIDGGGMISAGEPTVQWEANGCKMRTYVRQLPFVAGLFRELGPVNRLPETVTGFGGFHRKYILSLATVAASIETMKRLVSGTESLRQELEIDIQKAINTNPHVFSKRHCGCLSGLTYGDCCGKYVESAKSKEMRKGTRE